jgi:succinate dehydrogenase / fumarate reductase cytochrome b subunit
VTGTEGGPPPPVQDARRDVPAPEAVDVRLGGVAFLVNRAAGLGLVAYLYLHLLMLSMLVRGPDAWDNFVDLASSPPFLALDVVLVAGLLVHAANGIRVAAIGIGLVARGERARVTAASPLAGQIASGVALLVLVTLHLVAQHLVVPTGLRYAEDVVTGLRSPVMLAMEIAVLVFVAYHALAGVRVVLADIGFSLRTEERIVRILGIVWIGTIVYGVALFAAILAAA